jgi:hypothetical protein
VDKNSAIKLIRQAYDALAPLNNIQWTQYRNQCLELACIEEKAHRRTAPTDRRFGLTTTDAAKLFVVQYVASAIVNPKRLAIKDVLHTKPSAIYAASIVANHRAVCLHALKPFGLTELLALDYAELVNGEASHG